MPRSIEPSKILLEEKSNHLAICTAVRVVCKQKRYDFLEVCVDYMNSMFSSLALLMLPTPLFPQPSKDALLVLSVETTIVV